MNQWSCFFQIILLCLLVTFANAATNTTSVITITSCPTCGVRAYIADLDKEITSLKCTQTKVQSSVNILMNVNGTSTILDLRTKSLVKITSAINSLVLERSVLNDKCTRTSGDFCNETCVDGYGGADCSQFTCSGVIASDPTVCSGGNNTCIGPNICNCVNGGMANQTCKLPPVALTKDVVKGFAYSSGVYATSCLNYRNATYPYTYNGEGSGLYQIKPGSTVMTVYCDMDTDGGGWTLFAGIRSDYWGDQFHVFDDANALVSASATTFHIQTTDLLAISKEIRVGTDKPTAVISSFYTAVWPNSASCVIPDTLRADILYTKSVQYSTLSAFTRPERGPASCKVLSGVNNLPTHMSYCKTPFHSVGFRMGIPIASEQAHYANNANFATFSYPNAAESGNVQASYYGVYLTGDYSTSRNGVLFLR